MEGESESCFNSIPFRPLTQKSQLCKDEILHRLSLEVQVVRSPLIRTPKHPLLQLFPYTFPQITQGKCNSHPTPPPTHTQVGLEFICSQKNKDFKLLVLLPFDLQSSGITGPLLYAPNLRSLDEHSTKGALLPACHLFPAGPNKA